MSLEGDMMRRLTSSSVSLSVSSSYADAAEGDGAAMAGDVLVDGGSICDCED